MVESNNVAVSRELHDELGQLLTSLKFDLASVKRMSPRVPKRPGLEVRNGWPARWKPRICSLSACVRSYEPCGHRCWKS